MLNKKYAYITPIKTLKHSDDQHAALTKYAFPFGIKSYDYVFTEYNEGSEKNSRIAFDIMINTLKPGDVVYIYSVHALADDQESFGLDILLRLRKIMDKGAEIAFYLEKASTATPQQRYMLTCLVASIIYNFEIAGASASQGSTPVCCISK